MKIRKFLKNYIGTRICIELNHDIKNTILVAGSGRSGTTWLTEIINYNNSYRIIFEPFRRNKVRATKSLKEYQYIRPWEQDTVYLNLFNKVLSGRVHDKWVYSHNGKFFSNKRIVKAIRINLCLHWIKKNFPSIPILFIIRHPCAVAISKYKSFKRKGAWEPIIDHFLMDKNLIDDIISPLSIDMDEVKVSSLFEKYIWEWCIENFVVIKKFENSEIFMLSYESLCQNPKEITKEVFSYIGKKYEDEVEQYFLKPSTTSRFDSAIVMNQDPLTAWLKEVSDKQIENSLTILKKFDLDNVYNNHHLPLIKFVRS